MKRYSKWVLTGVALTTIGVLAGCGSVTNGPSNPSGTNAANNVTLTTNITGATNTTTATNTPPSSNSTSSSQGQNGVPQQVYVFTQPMLEEMYAVELFRSVGPIIPPQSVENGVTKWAPKVSMNMLPYTPASEQALDKLLIQNIESFQQTAPRTKLLSSLPGYTLHNDQLPSGTRTYWYPSNNKFPQWVNPTVMNFETDTGSQTLVSVTVPLANGSAFPAMTLDVPKGWTEQKEGQGDTSGQAWVNPSNKEQQIQVMLAYNGSAIQNTNTGQWDVTELFGKGNAGVSWSNVSADKLTGDFVDTTKVNYYAKNEQTPYTGYGKAFVVKKPNPFGVYVEVWATNSLASLVLHTVLLQQGN